MVATDKLFAGSIPEIYDRFLVPLIFESYALDLAERLAKTDPRNVLETAAGTGVLTRAIASRLPGYVRVIATDLNQPMLHHATVRQSHDGRIEWRQADALTLPFEDQSFDVVTCQFGAMFFPDKVAGYREARRVLRPGGRFVFSVWDSLEHNPMTRCVVDAAAARYPQNPPRFLARTPHGHHDVEGIRRELAEAGFDEPVIDIVTLPSRAPSADHPAVGFCQGTPMRAEIEALDPSGLAAATDAVTAAVRAVFGAGPIEAPMQALVITARKTGV
jgi:ubiquinone/menaquinone biosynthesis C-methylase UbiE